VRISTRNRAVRETKQSAVPKRQFLVALRQGNDPSSLQPIAKNNTNASVPPPMIQDSLRLVVFVRTTPEHSALSMRHEKIEKIFCGAGVDLLVQVRCHQRFLIAPWRTCFSST
jgi:hypothetical protein